MTDEPRKMEIKVGNGVLAMAGERVELWKYGTHAPAWFTDAKREATLEDEQARRREIIFAVCAVESYLFEWVRDNVLKGEFRLLNHYFPITREGRGVGIVERWKQVINHLYGRWHDHWQTGLWGTLLGTIQTPGSLPQWSSSWSSQQAGYRGALRAGKTRADI